MTITTICCRVPALAILISGMVSPIAHATLVNLAQTATGFGVLPGVTLASGSAAGIADGSAWEWNTTVGTSPRLSTGTLLQPYLTWATPQTISSVRVWNDYINPTWHGPPYDRLIVDTLVNGGNPTVESDWVQRYDSGTGLNKDEREIALGGEFTTTGLRVRASTSGAEGTKVVVGEVAVFGGLRVAKPDAARVMPTGASASSTLYVDRTPSQVNDKVWLQSYWLSRDSTANPGDFYTLDLAFNSVKLNAASLTFGNEAPTSWTLQYNSGSGFQTIGTYTPAGDRRMYYYDLATSGSITALRLLVPESARTGGIKVMEFEAFYFVPEPSTFLLLAIGGGLLWHRGFKAKHSP